jgi:hypothetical protein
MRDREGFNEWMCEEAVITRYVFVDVSFRKWGSLGLIQWLLTNLICAADKTENGVWQLVNRNWTYGGGKERKHKGKSK